MKIKYICVILSAVCFSAYGKSEYKLMNVDVDYTDTLSIQRGLGTYINYCIACHSMKEVTLGSLKKVGLTESQIKDFVVFNKDAKMTEYLKSSLDPKSAKVGFGIVPPDLSLSVRSRGEDWLYTYFLSFYEDSQSSHGWNNPLIPGLAMPHVLANIENELKKVSVGNNNIEYNNYIKDLVTFLAFASEPNRVDRKIIGLYVVLFLIFLLIPFTLLKNEFWKDIKK